MESPSMPPPPQHAAETSAGDSQPPPMPETPESRKRVRQPRNSACEKCAGLKMKCVRNADGERCERCTRMGLECIASVPKPRKRREGEFIPAHGSGTVSTESPADANSTPIRHSRTLPSPISKPPAPSNFTNAPPDSLLSRSDLHHTGSKSFTSLLAQGLELDRIQTPSTELLRGIDANGIVHACTVFRQYSAKFPFVSLSLRIDAVTMALQRPLTALAVYTVTAAGDRERQERTSHSFRLALAAKVVVNGERSVDALAALLIYVAWNHHYISSQQIYQYLCLLSGMTADLGLYKNPPRADVKDATVAAELDRTFVGAYCLCSLIPNFAFNKHSPMRWTDNLRICADNVAQAGEFQSDRAVVSLLELAAAVDDFQTVLQTHPTASTSRHYTELQAKAAGQRLRALRRDHQSLANSTILAACSVDIQYKQSQAHENPDPSIIIQCACSVKEYFDDILSRPPSFLHLMPLVDWICLLHVAVLMSRLSKQAASATGWEHGALASMLQPEQTMEKLLNHMASAPASDPLAPRNDGLLHWLHLLRQSIRNILLANDSAAAARQTEGTDGRFRPMNSESLPLSDRSLPYQSQDRSARDQMPGVLDQDFWTKLASGG